LPGGSHAQVFDVGALVYAFEQAHRRAPRLDPAEQAGLVQFLQDHRNAHRRLDVAAVAHVVDVVGLVDQQGDAARLAAPRHRQRGHGALVARLAQFGRIVAERRGDRLGLGGVVQVAVLAPQDRGNDPAQELAPRRREHAEAVEHQVVQVAVAGMHRAVVTVVDDRAHAEAFVETHAPDVARQGHGVGGAVIVDAAFQVQAAHVQRQRFFAHELVEHAADAAAAAAARRGDQFEEADVEVGQVQQHGEAEHLAAGVFDHQQDRTIAVMQRVVQLARDLGQILRARGRETLGDDRLHLGDRIAIGR
jgi:hypothetical protein